MNPQYSFWQKLVTPLLVGVLILTSYLVFKHNPEIMSQESLLTHLMRQSENAEKLITSESLTDEAAANSFFTPTTETSTGRRAHRYVEMKSEKYSPIQLPTTPFDWRTTGPNIIFRTAETLTVAQLNGQNEWTFKLPAEQKFSPGPLSVLGATLYVSTQNGQTYALHIPTGRVLWYKTLPQKLFHAPLLAGENLLIFNEEKANQTWGLSILNAKSGQTLSHIEKLELPLSGTPATSNTEFYFATETGRLHAYSIDSATKLWSAEGSSGFRSRPLLTADRIYLANEDGLVLSFDRKTGKKIAEIDAESPIEDRLEVTPGLPMAFAVDLKGSLINLDMTSSKRLWRYQLNLTETQYPALSLYKLNANSQAQLRFESAVGGWSAWVSCSSTRLCIFDVKTGQLLHRIELKGKPVGPFEFASGPISTAQDAISGGSNEPLLYIPIERSGKAILAGYEIPEAPVDK